MYFSAVVHNFIMARNYARFHTEKIKKIHSLDLNVNFVYFPLHLQPELTTSTLGGDFSDQLDAIELLKETIPEDWFIYVKENPKQGHEQRGVEFYNRLSTFRNVVYIDAGIDTYLLMKNCRFVATITGTAGWEAITGGKACLIFGKAWYLTLPGVVQYKEGITLKDILEISISETQFQEKFSYLYSKTRAGIVDGVYKEITLNYKKNENTQKLLKFIDEVLG